MNGVLIIDDNPIDVRLQERVLKRCSRFGPINSVSNGQEALDWLLDSHPNEAKNGFPPALVLLDVNMPVVDGFEFIARLTQQTGLDCEYKIVMLSSSNADFDRERARQFERIDRMLVKPLTTADAMELADCYLPKSGQ